MEHGPRSLAVPASDDEGQAGPEADQPDQELGEPPPHFRRLGPIAGDVGRWRPGVVGNPGDANSGLANIAAGSWWVRSGQNGRVPVRVDKWLWSVRVYKTRTKATAACSSGRVLVNDQIAKPATHVGPGDVVTAKRRDRVFVYAVVEPISKRVSAARARECMEDRSPPPEPRKMRAGAPLAQREPGSGRPTKRDRREIDRLRRRR